MSFKPLIWKGHIFGEKFLSPHFSVYFFNKHFKPQLWSNFSQTQFCSLNQVHGKLCLKANPTTQITADGHFTQNKSLALAIRTADCVPVLIYSQKTIYALHCGWRSLAQNIIGRSFKKHSLTQASIFIGPHIRPNSYEVSHDVLSFFEKDHNHPFPIFTFKETSPRPFLNLENIIKNQLLNKGCHLNQIHTSNINTYSHADYSSYRKDKTPRRQWSFISL